MGKRDRQGAPQRPAVASQNSSSNTAATSHVAKQGNGARSSATSKAKAASALSKDVNLSFEDMLAANFGSSDAADSRPAKLRKGNTETALPPTRPQGSASSNRRNDSENRKQQELVSGNVAKQVAKKQLEHDEDSEDDEEDADDSEDVDDLASDDAGSDGDDQDGEDGEEDGSDEDDEDESSIDETGVPADDEDTELSVSAHKKQLEALRQQDPKFYEYLQKNSKALLDFGEGEEDDEDNLDDEQAGADNARVAGDDDGAEEDGAEGEDGEKQAILITPALARKVFDAAFKPAAKGATSSSSRPGYSYTSLGKALSMLRAAAYLGDAPDVLGRLGLGGGPQKKLTGPGGKTGKDARGEDRMHAAEREASKAPVLLRYRVSSPGVFMLIVTQVLQHAGAAFAHHLGKTKAPGVPSSAPVPAPRVPLASYTGWSKIELPSRALVKLSLMLLGQATDPSLQLYILRALRQYVPYLQTQGALTRKATALFIRLWAESEDEGVKMEAFLRARQVATALPHPALDMVLKGLYHAYARAGKAMSETTAPGLQLMCTCLAEVYGLDDSAAYTHAFVYIRDLAVHLRAALTTKTKEAVTKVMSWQFLSCLRAWTGVVVAHGSDPSRQLFQLAYPLTQVILGAIRLQPSPRYFPFRLHAVALLNELSWATGTYIPIAPLLWDVLRSPLLQKRPKEVVSSGGGGPTPLTLMVRAGNTTVATKAFQDAIVNKTLDLLLDGLKASYASPAFPEISAPVVIQLRHFAKETRVTGWRARARALVDALQAQATTIATKRASLQAAPADKAAVAQFMAVELDKLKADRATARAAAAKQALAEARAAAAEKKEAEKREAEAAKKGRKRRAASESDEDQSESEGSDSEDEGEDGEDIEVESEEEDGDGSEESEGEPVKPSKPVKNGKPSGSSAHGAHAAGKAAPSRPGQKANGKLMKAPAALAAKLKGKLPADEVKDFDASDLMDDDE